MRFTDGNWLMRSDVTPTYMASVSTYSRDGDTVTLYTTPRLLPPDARRRELGGSMLTVELSAPMNDVIGVTITHWKGSAKKGPDFVLSSENADVSFEELEDKYIYRSGRLSVDFNKASAYGQKSAVFKGDGQMLTAISSRGMAHFATGEAHFGDNKTGKSYIGQDLDIGVGECLYGFGEKFTPFVKNGQTVEMWMADGGTGSDQSYKNVPFYLSNRGYGVFVNSPADVSFEVATEKVERACFSVEGETMQYFLIYGKTPKEIIERYTRLTGRPALPPAWSFGLWLSTSFTTNYDEKTVTSFIQGMADRKIPLSVFHFDCFWMKGNHWTDFSWDPDMFPDPKGMLARYKERGLHICVWINPYIAQRSCLFDECVEKGYLIKRTDGSVWQTDLWQSGMGVVDFTNPDACAWYQSKLKELMDMGVDTFKTDFGERIPVRDVVYFDGSDPLRMHNYYTHLYNKCVFEAIEQYRGKGEAVVFARSGTAGGQQFPLHWGGDNAGNYPSMAETLRAGLSMAMSGYAFWSHDIGGFEATAAPDLYKRWCAFGLFSSHSRLHGSGSYRVPWLFDEQASEVLRRFVELKCRLMPYTYLKAIEAHKEGTPVLRPMVFEFMRDPVCAYLDTQYMFGDKLLAAPIFSEDGKVSFYVPEGKWTSFFTDKVYEGGKYYTETHDYFSLPLLVRPNTLLPIGDTCSRPDYDYASNLTLALYQPEEGAELVAEIPNTRGEIEAVVRVCVQDGSARVSCSRLLEGLKLRFEGKEYEVKGQACTITL